MPETSSASQLSLTGVGDNLPVSSYSWGVTIPVSMSAGGGGGAGKASFNDFHFTLAPTGLSPALWGTLASGQHLRRVVLLYGVPGTGKTHTVRYLLGKDRLEFFLGHAGPCNHPPLL